MSAKAADILTKEEITELHRRSDMRGLIAIASCWAVIAGAFALAAWHPVWWTVLVALVILGSRQLGLAILMHEAAHHSLFASRPLNNVLGSWFAGYPIWTDLWRYREHHMRHHAFTGSGRDPDMALVRPFPVTRRSLRRKLMRDLLGRTGLRRLIGLVLMDIGYFTYDVSGAPKKLPMAGRSGWDILWTGMRNMHGVIITNVVLYLILRATGNGWLYWLWAGAYLTTFSVFIRVRSIAEHACTPNQADDPWGNMRTTLAGPLSRFLFAPYCVNYHLEHHLLLGVPWYNLPRMHRMLAQRVQFDDASLVQGYRRVLAMASSKSN